MPLAFNTSIYISIKSRLCWNSPDFRLSCTCFLIWTGLLCSLSDVFSSVETLSDIQSHSERQFNRHEPAHCGIHFQACVNSQSWICVLLDRKRRPQITDKVFEKRLGRGRGGGGGALLKKRKKRTQTGLCIICSHLGTPTRSDLSYVHSFRAQGNPSERRPTLSGRIKEKEKKKKKRERERNSRYEK